MYVGTEVKKDESTSLIVSSQHVMVLSGLNRVGVSEYVGGVKNCKEYCDSSSFEYYFKSSI